MRPCNQCGTPVENNEVVCAECVESNKETGYVPVASVRPFGPDNPAKPVEPDYDTSLGTIGTVFHAIIMSIGALTAYALGGGVVGVVGGAFLGLIMSYLIFRTLI